MFHEEITNRVLDDLVAACEPRWAKVIGIMNPRGGIAITVMAEYCREGIPTPLKSDITGHSGSHGPPCFYECCKMSLGFAF